MPWSENRMAIHVSLALALIGSLGLALLLLVWGERGSGTRLLVGFLLGVCVWIIGNELPNWAGPDTKGLAFALLATAPLTAAVFLHFAVSFSGFQQGAALLPWTYGVSGATSVFALIFRPGTFEPFAGMAWVAFPNALGVAASVLWGLVALSGLLILLRQGLQREGLMRRQTLMVAFAAAWGVACMSGYAMIALRLDLYPWPLLGFPIFPILLVYSVLRYRVLAASVWARRGLVWTGLITVAALAAALLSGLPFLAETTSWVSAISVATAVVIFSGPVRRLAERLIYPGARVSDDDISVWRQSLSQSADTHDLADRASQLLSHKLRTQIAVQVADKPATLLPATPALICTKTGGDTWLTRLAFWEGAPPGPQQVALLFGNLLAEEAERLERAAERTRMERERMEQARLVELGGLAATVAHDIRNPLNAISMAAAAASPEVRGEIRQQIARISRLTQDLLDYAKPWHIEPQEFDLSALVRAEVRTHPEVEIGPGLQTPLNVWADPRRLQQALINLLDNAVTAADRRRVEVDIETGPAGALRIMVSDDGAGVPEELKDRLFQPFVSLRPGGTGLGLAIVSKIAQAHGGSAALMVRPGWRTCFALDLPEALKERQMAEKGYGK
jgi:signal transduction histidine kinase